MSRNTYICTLLPSLMLLNSGATLSSIMGAASTSVLGVVLGLVVWMLVWRRLYGARGRTLLRPEFSLLAILPQEAFFALNYCGPEAAEPFAEGIWPGINLLLWCASVWIILASLSPRLDGSSRSGWRDPASLIASAFVLLSSYMGWVAGSAHLFPFLTQS